MCDRKPSCGSLGKSTDDTLTSLFALIGIVSAIGGGVGGAISLANAGVPATATAAAGSLSNQFTILGVTAPLAVWLAAAVAGLATLAVIGYLVYARCYPVSDKENACSSGVIQHIEPSFSSTEEELFPFAAMHDRVDVVVVCDYWHLVEGGGAKFVKCAPDRDASPMLLGFYYSKEVCAAGAGALYGAAAALVPGIIAGALVGAAIGCATVIFCLLALLVAALIVVAAVLAGAFIGGQIGKALAGDSTPSAGGKELSEGDLVTTKGGLITNGDQDGARTYWWVDSTVLHGRSSATSPYSHRDAEAILKDPVTGQLFDACGQVQQPLPGDTTSTDELPRIDSVSNVNSYGNCYKDYKVTASATAPSGIAKLELLYKIEAPIGTGSWQAKLMIFNSGTGLYEATIQDLGTVTYYIRAFANDGSTTDSIQYSTLLFCVK